MKLRTSTNMQYRERKSMRLFEISEDTNKLLTKEVGLNGAYLFLLYRSLAPYKDANLEDSTVASKINLSEYMVKKLRLKLTKNGWFLRELDKRKGKRKVIYHIGKEAVASVRNHSKNDTVDIIVNNKIEQKDAPFKFGKVAIKGRG